MQGPNGDLWSILFQLIDERSGVTDFVKVKSHLEDAGLSVIKQNKIAFHHMLANSLAGAVAEEAAKRLLPDLNLERKAKWAERVGVGVAKRLALVQADIWAKSAAILAQVGIQAPGLSFRCICHLGKPIKTRFESGFVCCVHRMSPVACRPIIKCGKSGCTGSCPLSGKPAACRACGKTFPRPNVTPSDFFRVKSDKKKGNNSRNVSPVTSRSSRNTSPASLEGQVFPGVTHRAIKRYPKVRMQSWRTARSLIRLRSASKSEHTTNCVKFSRTCQMNTNRSSVVTVSRQKCSRWMMRKWSCWQPRGNSYFFKVGLRNERIIWSEYPGRLRRNNDIVWTFYKNGSMLTRNWMQHTPNRSRPSMKCRFWLPNRPQKMRRLSIRALQEPSNPDPDAQQTILSVFKSVLSMHNMGCHSVAEQLMAAGATDEEVKKISQIMAQTVRKLEGGSTIPEPGIEVCKQYTSNTPKFYEKWLRRKQWLRQRAMRTSVRRTTASSQTTTGTTRTTCSSTSTTPMTTLTPTIAWCTSCIRLADSAHSSTLDDDTAHLIGSSSQSIHCHPRSYSWHVLFGSTSPFFLYLFFLPFSVFFLYPELFLELDNRIVMAILRYSVAEESEDTMNSFTSHTKCPNLRVMWYWTQSSLRAYLDSAAWISKAKKPSRGVCMPYHHSRMVFRS